ncbi:MAG: formylglycine-generating enzyme family protein [Leeuwenhoekiella sp.]
MNKRFISLITFFCLVAVISTNCKNETTKETKKTGAAKVQKERSSELLVEKPDTIKVPDGMVWVSGVRFTQGAPEADQLALPRERPAHPVAVDGFFIDKTEVTNAEFAEFVDATGYLTVAERPIDWEEIKKQLPQGTPKPADSILQPGSLIFNRKVTDVRDLRNYSQWWEWKIGANWKHPRGPESTIDGKDDYPVVHVAYEDALAYCKWANRKLPTEAQWEAAAHGKLHGGIYTWGDDDGQLDKRANTWQGEFPNTNAETDGYAYAAPVASYDPNTLGIYDMSGNVWEITQDWFSVRYYQELVETGVARNPAGPAKSFNPQNALVEEKVIKGGSFLCDDSYCASYRISARMGQSLDSASDHTGFRTVATPQMLAAKTTN